MSSPTTDLFFSCLFSDRIIVLHQVLKPLRVTNITLSRSVLKISPEGKITTIFQESNPWTPTGVTVYHGEVFVLEWHDVSASLSEVRTAYIPRIQKIGSDGKVTLIATVSR